MIEAFVLKRIKLRIHSKWSHNFTQNIDGVRRKECNLTKINNYRKQHSKLNKWTNLHTYELKPAAEVKDSRMEDLKIIMYTKQRIFKKFER